MVSHKVVLSRKVVLSWQALFRVPQVVSLRTSGGCGDGCNLGTVIRYKLAKLGGNPTILVALHSWQLGCIPSLETLYPMWLAVTRQALVEN